MDPCFTVILESDGLYYARINGLDMGRFPSEDEAYAFRDQAIRAYLQEKEFWKTIVPEQTSL